jgi:hypothetical protein
MRPGRLIFGLAALSISVFLAATPKPAAPTAVPMATEDRMDLPGWWPTKGTASRSEFVGPDACADCHATKVRTQKLTPMAHAALRPIDSEAFLPTPTRSCASQTAASIPSAMASRRFQPRSVGHSAWANPARPIFSNVTERFSKVV